MRFIVNQFRNFFLIKNKIIYLLMYGLFIGFSSFAICMYIKTDLITKIFIIALMSLYAFLFFRIIFDYVNFLLYCGLEINKDNDKKFMNFRLFERLDIEFWTSVKSYNLLNSRPQFKAYKNSLIKNNKPLTQKDMIKLSKKTAF